MQWIFNANLLLTFMGRDQSRADCMHSADKKMTYKYAQSSPCTDILLMAGHTSGT